MTADSPSSFVPKLRFPEFRDASAWSISPLGSVCDVLNNQRVPITTTDRKNGSFPYYGASGIVDYVDDFIFDERLILVGEDGAKWGIFEQTAFIAHGKYWVNNHAHVLRSVDLIDSLLEAYLVRSDLGIYVTGAAPPKLTLGKLKTIPIPIPSSPDEQQKIADCLVSLDDLIAAKGRKLETLHQHKQGLMQQLFPQPGETVPRLRFPEFRLGPEWDMRTLSSATDVNPPNDGLPESFIYIDLESVKSNMLIERKEITREAAPSRAQRRLSRNDIIYQTVRPYQRNNLFFDINDGREYVASTGYAQLRAHESPEFLYQLLHTDSFVSSVLDRCTGSNYPAINPSTLASIDVMLPRKTEQQKIADLLGSLDGLIAAEGRKLEALRQHKQGLTQQLFPPLDGQ